MSDMMACAACGKMKAVDGYLYCGGDRCLEDDPLDQLLDEDWSAEGNANEPETP